MSGADRYPHVLDPSSNVWHRTRHDSIADGPAYPTVCGITVTTYCVDVVEGPAVDEWESLCKRCYP